MCIVSQSHLCRNPRVLKEALALSCAGYDVSILTAIYSEELLKEDLSLLGNTGIKYEIYSDLSGSDISVFKNRFVRKFSTLLQTLFGIESKYSLGYNVNGLKKRLKHHNADLYIMHQELGTVIGGELISGHNVAFDIEDWYSEDLLPNARQARPIKLLKKAEKKALESGIFCITTSLVMANGLKEFYKTERTPFVIYNSFPPEDKLIVTPGRENIKRLYWFSQTIGPGRGLEFFINCMSKTDFSWELNLRGNIHLDFHNTLKEIISTKDSLNILPLQKNDELLSGMCNYDFGLALEPNSPLNKDLTISNKLFHYMAAGLPVIASDTLGQQEIGNNHTDIVFLYQNDKASNLVDLLNKIGRLKQNDIEQLKDSVIGVYKEKYSWDIESQKLIKLIRNATETIS